MKKMRAGDAASRPTWDTLEAFARGQVQGFIQQLLEFLSFLRHIDENVPPDLAVHLILDNYGTHKHAKVRAWLARHPRFHVHFTPTYASWLNQVERWFGLITQPAIRRGSFRNVRELVQRIDTFVTRYNRTAQPFAWTATADSNFAKLHRLLSRINGTQH
jgi:transposase